MVKRVYYTHRIIFMNFQSIAVFHVSQAELWFFKIHLTFGMCHKTYFVVCKCKCMCMLVKNFIKLSRIQYLMASFLHAIYLFTFAHFSLQTLAYTSLQLKIYSICQCKDYLRNGVQKATKIPSSFPIYRRPNKNTHTFFHLEIYN